MSGGEGKRDRGAKAPAPKRTRDAAPASGEDDPAPPPASPDAPAPKRKRTRKAAGGKKPAARIPSRRELTALARASTPRETAVELGIKVRAKPGTTPLPPEPEPVARAPFGGKREKESPPWMKEAAARIEAAGIKEEEARETLIRRADIKAGRGRPTKYESWMCEAVVNCGRAGMEIVEIAVDLGVCRDTLYEWAKVHAEFSDALTRAREAAEAFHARNVRFQMQLPSQATNASAYLSYMGRRFTDWREAQKLEVTSSTANALAKARKRAAERSKAAVAATGA